MIIQLKNKREIEYMKWLLLKGMEITNSNQKYDFFDDTYDYILNTSEKTEA